ncbi:MAG: choice-of-anchor M domain-containing protein [Microbacterium sp.]
MILRKTRLRPATGAALLLTLAALLVPSIASADEIDPLDQTIDPNQSQGTGQVVRESGHVDFGPTMNTGEWIIQIHDDTETPSYWRHLEDVVMKVNDASVLPIPDSEAYSFLAEEPGTDVWVVPQTQKTGVIWTGWNTQEPNVLNSLNMGTTLHVLGVDGPGDVSVYLQSGNFGDPQPLWSTHQPFPQQSWIEVNTHTHANWVFSEPGIYLVEIQFDAELGTGESVSARDTLRFAVGDETDPQQAFGMTFAASEAPTPQPSEPAADAAASPGESDALGTILWVVVGGVVVALIIAVVIVGAATRRAKTRALAARHRTGTSE